MKIKYVAYDNREFNTKEECMEYEEIMPDIIMVNSDFKLQTSFDKTEYLFIPNQKALNCLTKIFSTSYPSLGWNCYNEYNGNSTLYPYSVSQSDFKYITKLKNKLEKISRETPSEIIKLNGDFRRQDFSLGMSYIFIPSTNALNHLNDNIDYFNEEINIRNLEIGWNFCDSAQNGVYYSSVLKRYEYEKYCYERKLRKKEQLDRIAKLTK